MYTAYTGLLHGGHWGVCGLLPVTLSAAYHAWVTLVPMFADNYAYLITEKPLRKGAVNRLKAHSVICLSSE